MTGPEPGSSQPGPDRAAGPAGPPGPPGRPDPLTRAPRTPRTCRAGDHRSCRLVSRHLTSSPRWATSRALEVLLVFGGVVDVRGVRLADHTRAPNRTPERRALVGRGLICGLATHGRPGDTGNRARWAGYAVAAAHRAVYGSTEHHRVAPSTRAARWRSAPRHPARPVRVDGRGGGAVAVPLISTPAAGQHPARPHRRAVRGPGHRGARRVGRGGRRRGRPRA